MSRERGIWIATSVILLLAALASVFFRASPTVPPTWSYILAPEKTSFAYFAGPVAVSHDGRKLVFVATTPEGQDVVWVRTLGATNAQALAGTEGATYPFWSGDDRSIGFFAGGKLKTVGDAGGPVVWGWIYWEARRGAGSGKGQRNAGPSTTAFTVRL